MKYKILILLIPLIFIAGLFIFADSNLQSNLGPSADVLSLESSRSAAARQESKPAFSRGFSLGENLIQEKIKNQEKLNIIILGYGGENHAGAYLTDTIILGQINCGGKEVKLVNIPRDLWVENRKINSIYADRQKAEDLIAILEDDLNLTIDLWVTIDFDGFRSIIDEFGGIEILVQKGFDDYNYPRNDNDQVDAGVMHIHFDQGWQKMDGEQALRYARSRYGVEDGGDFNRSFRQQQVLVAIKNELLKAQNIWRYFSLFKIVRDNFSTNLTTNEMWSLWDYLRNDPDLKIEDKIISTDNFLYASHTSDGAYILLPKGGNFKAIQQYLDF